MWIYDGGPGYDIEERDEKVCEDNVKSVCKNAFIRRTIKYGRYSYQVVVREFLFWFKPIGDSHTFKDQAWQSAYAMMREKGFFD
jgi:hypothetical protein